MTDEQINKAIAEACGWTDFVVHPEFGLMGTPPHTHGLRTAVDWYTFDLNAMHEAEKVLKTAHCHEYTNLLYDFACKAQEENGKWLPYGIPARQRAEAFLRTLGKWEEAK
jgi:hypothetical protein